MSEDNCLSKRTSSTESGAIDYKARKRIEELFLLTDELLRERSHETIRYDKKLYKKYKEMKEINKKLQEKLLDYHCSGCQCHRPNPAVQVVPSSSSTENVDNSRKLISDAGTGNEHRPNGCEKSTTPTNQADEVMIIDEINPQEKRRLRDENGHLPESLQKIIRNSVRTHYNRRNYLLRVGLHPPLCEYLCNRSSNSFYRRPCQAHVRSFVVQQIRKPHMSLKSLVLRIADELKEVHQTYLLQFIDKPPCEETIGRRMKEHHRTAAQNKKN